MASASSSSGSGVAAPEPPPLEVPHWLKSLPLAPEFHPTIQEFQDPIAYILKIEKEAAAYGICKIVPPVPEAPKKTALANLNRSFAARDPAGGGRKLATFTTRQQQIGFCPRRPRPVQKPVWQSGERYTLQQFETKAHQFERSHLRRATSRKVASADALSPLEVETLFWRASADKPFSVEYANDMPGSGFAPLPTSTRCWREEPPSNVGESAWNMRGVSRAKGSLLRFMKEEIPGVTSPMVYVAMLFSWFAWHVEDHELHSMNYLHMGAGKTWYGMPRDAGLAFEEVVRVHGYGEEVNPLVTFAILGEKTTVMSPEVLVGAGIPCCRLVQNAGDFVVTFPGAYHSGFSHGFNCGEAANIATPEWLRFAKEAAVRRASINYPPMVSHFHLLYALALSLCTRIPIGVGSEPRSSRLKDKMKGEGEEMVKNAFVQSVIQNNHLLNILLDDGTSCVVLPQNAPESPLYSNSLVRSQVKIKPRLSLGLCSHQEALEASRLLPSSEFGSCLNTGVRDFSGLLSFARNPSLENGKMTSSGTYGKFLNAECHSVASDSQNMDGAKDGALQGDGLLDQGLLSCVTCGILSFACVAIIQPREAAAKYLISADCDLINDHVLTSGPVGGLITSTNQTTSSNNLANRIVQVSDQSAELSADGTCSRGISALDLLASVYADSSDIEDEDVQDEAPLFSDKNHTKDLSPCDADHHIEAADEPQNICSKEETNLQLTEKKNQIGISAQSSQCADVSISLNGHTDDVADIKDQQKSELSSLNQSEIGEIVRLSDLEDNGALETNGASVNCSELDDSCRNIGSTEIYYSRLKMRNRSVKHDICGNPIISAEEGMIHPEISNVAVKMATLKPLVMQGSDRDCSRMHVFCLEHAAEIEKQLKPIGGVDMMLLCHPDYPKIESEAKLLAKELGIGYSWKNIKFREANEEDQTRIKAALEDEEVMPMNSDWTVKLGINLYYTASLSKSPLYSKQMPYNRVIYKAFGCSSTGNSPIKSKASARRPGRQKKLVLAGRWCGKVWMSNQVHPYLAHKKKTQEQEQTEELYSHEADEKPLIEIDIDNSSKASSKRKPSGSSLAAKTSGKKRKKPSRKTVNKKPRYTTDINSKDEDASGTCETPQGRTLRSSNIHYTESIDHLKSSWKDGSGGPSTRLRKRSPKPEEFKNRSTVKKQTAKRKAKKSQSVNSDGKDAKEQYTCDFVGCGMSFSTEHDLALHKHDICPVKDCGRKTSRKRKAKNSQYANLVTKDEKQYTCDTEGCSMSFSMKQDLVSHQRDACLMKGCGKKHSRKRKAKNSKSVNLATKDVEEQYMCDVEGCSMTFSTKKDLAMHKREICLGKDCAKKQSRKRKDKNPQSSNNAIRDEEEQYTCNIEGCSMSFSTKQDLSLHKRDICPVKGCGKKFFSHKYLLQHRKVHTDDRPLVCPWKGCKMTFKWAWARTEHIRVHTGDRPYICSEPGCGQTFRFVSDFSRHKRKTGHSAKRARR